MRLGMKTIAPFRITVCGIDELAYHRDASASHVLSILDPAWPVPEVFGEFGEHEKLELRFHDVIEDVAGMLAPQPDDVLRLLTFGRDLLAEPSETAHLLVHCHAGISRSTAAMALILALARLDLPPEAIMAEILRIRPKAWPNLRILEIGDTLLRGGPALTKAVGAVYREQMLRFPNMAEAMIRGGRRREVEAGWGAAA
jgi:predicted protein tyrosine phosphatase